MHAVDNLPKAENVFNLEKLLEKCAWHLYLTKHPFFDCFLFVLSNNIALPDHLSNAKDSNILFIKKRHMQIHFCNV